MYLKKCRISLCFLRMHYAIIIIIIIIERDRWWSLVNIGYNLSNLTVYIINMWISKWFTAALFCWCYVADMNNKMYHAFIYIDTMSLIVSLRYIYINMKKIHKHIYIHAVYRHEEKWVWLRILDADINIYIT